MDGFVNMHPHNPAQRRFDLCRTDCCIGPGKRTYLPLALAQIGIMRAIKQALDPQNLMNPGKVLPPEVLP
jgi:D-lactate dehydrogenase (cytochrome)